MCLFFSVLLFLIDLHFVVKFGITFNYPESSHIRSDTYLFQGSKKCNEVSQILFSSPPPHVDWFIKRCWFNLFRTKLKQRNIIYQTLITFFFLPLSFKTSDKTFKPSAGQTTLNVDVAESSSTWQRAPGCRLCDIGEYRIVLRRIDIISYRDETLITGTVLVVVHSSSTKFPLCSHECHQQLFQERQRPPLTLIQHYTHKNNLL